MWIILPTHSWWFFRIQATKRLARATRNPTSAETVSKLGEYHPLPLV